MIPRPLLSLLALGTLPLLDAQEAAVTLPPFTVHSPRVANQNPSGTYAAPVSVLRYEPRVDVEGRNFAEAQADVTVRGGIFTNTGFRIGAVSLSDPQTGHYFAEIPIDPSMLGAPDILTGADQAFAGYNATVAAVAYDWRPIGDEGLFVGGVGEYGTVRYDLYEGRRDLGELGKLRVASDLAVAHSRSAGPVENGDHDFDRVSGRVQLAGAGSQTDLYAGYQEKFFGWPNLYTPFNSNESEHIETVLLGANQRTDLGGGDFAEAGFSYRRLKDDYAFNRFAPVGAVHPFQHTTWLYDGAVTLRRTLGSVTWNLRGEASADEITSTSLVYGSYRTRNFYKLAVMPERSWPLPGGDLRIRAGFAVDGSNHNGTVGSPLLEVAREWQVGAMRRLYAGFSRSTQAPSYTALKSNPAAGLFRGNPSLSRSASDNLELGAEFADQGWTLHTALFARDDKGLVDWTFRQGVIARSANPVDIVTTGAEAVLSGTWTCLDVVAGATVLSKNEDYRGAAVDASFYALNYPRARLTLAVIAHLTDDVELRLDNEFRDQESNPLRTAGGNTAFLSTISLAYRVPEVAGLELSAEVDNLWDESFQEVPGVPAAPRQFSAGATYRW